MAIYIYLVTSNILNGIKIGFWRSSLISLKSRYVTTYGKDVKILFAKTLHAPLLEKRVHNRFKQYNICNEIFLKDKLDEYIDYISNDQNLVVSSYDECSFDEQNLKTPFKILYTKPELRDQIMEYKAEQQYMEYEGGLGIHPINCVYVITLGLAKDLRGEMKIPDKTPDDHIIIKYGLTNKLIPLNDEHIKTYESIKGVQLELMKYCYVDPKYLSEAETYIKNYFSDMEAFVEYKKFAEIVSFDPKHTRQLNQTFDNIQCKYSGCVKGLLQEVEDLRGEIVMLKEKHKWELKDKDRELEIKDQIIATKDQTIITRDVELENARLKLQLLELKKSN